jgi:hypothetical protein
VKPCFNALPWKPLDIEDSDNIERSLHLSNHAYLDENIKHIIPDSSAPSRERRV